MLLRFLRVFSSIVFLFLAHFFLSNLSLQGDEIELPAKSPMPRQPVPEYINMRSYEKAVKRKERAYDIEGILEKVLHGSKQDIEQQAEIFAEKPEKFAQFLHGVAQNGISFPDGEYQEEKFSLSLGKVRQLLKLQYRDTFLLNTKISISLRHAHIEDALSLIHTVVPFNFVLDSDVTGVIHDLSLQEVSLAQALATILSHNQPRLALMREGGIYNIVTYERGCELVNHALRDQKDRDYEKGQFTVRHQRFTETFKMRLEKLWDGITKGKSSSKGYYLVFDDASKKIFFHGRRAEVCDFISYLREIDITVPQVKIEARVVIARKDFEENFGIQWSSVFNRRAGIRRGVSFVGSGPLENINNDPQPQTKENLLDFALNLLPTLAEETAKTLHVPFVWGGSDLNTKRLNLILNASENRDEIKTLLKPSLVTNHNEEAEILVGERIPIEVTVKETIEGSLRDITTVNYKDVGIKLRVRPMVAPDKKTIFMDIYVEDSFRSPTSFSSKFPVIETIRSQNRVIVNNGQTTLIGGLIKNENIRNRLAIPILSKIPLFGFLFRGSRKFTEDQQLLIFITPTVV